MFTCRIVGIRYQHAPQWSAALHALPSAVQVAVGIAWLHHQQHDWGNVHSKNNSMVDSQAVHFASWLGTVGYDDWSVWLINAAMGTMLLEGYLHAILTNALAHLCSLVTVLPGSTLLLYLNAALLWFHMELGLQVSIICPTTNKILPLFCNTFTQSLKWGMPILKWELYSPDVRDLLSPSMSSDKKRPPSSQLTVSGHLRLDPPRTLCRQ